MAIKTWTGLSSTDWNDPGNWSPPGIPGSSDDVVIGTTANSPALGASTTVNTITINGSDTLALTASATVLTVTSGVTLSSSGGISGTGTLAASVTTSGGTLEVTGAITDSGNALALSIAGATDRLLLDAHPGVLGPDDYAHTVTFGSSGTLELNLNNPNFAGLTVGTAMAIGAGTLL